MTLGFFGIAVGGERGGSGVVCFLFLFICLLFQIKQEWWFQLLGGPRIFTNDKDHGSRTVLMKLKKKKLRKNQTLLHPNLIQFLQVGY